MPTQIPPMQKETGRKEGFNILRRIVWIARVVSESWGALSSSCKTVPQSLCFRFLCIALVGDGERVRWEEEGGEFMGDDGWLWRGGRWV